MAEIHDPVDVALALDMATGKERRVATCHLDDEPLVGTFEFRGAEFVCVVCGQLYGFLGPKPAQETPGLLARLAELTARYERERDERQSEQHGSTEERA
jgi:hypothetical protein